MKKSRKFEILFVAGGLAFFAFSSSASADQLILTSGRIIEGKITDRSDEYVQFQIEAGMTLTFYSDEIASIEEDSLSEVKEQQLQEDVQEAGEEAASVGEKPVSVDVEPASADAEKMPMVEDVVPIDIEEKSSGDSVPVSYNAAEERVPGPVLWPSDANSVLSDMIGRTQEIEEMQMRRPQELMRQMEDGDY